MLVKLLSCFTVFISFRYRFVLVTKMFLRVRFISILHSKNSNGAITLP